MNTMNIRFSETLLRDMKHVLEETERRGDTLHAYDEAASIQARNPQDNVALEDIVDALLRGAGRILAVELQPPRTLEVSFVDGSDQAMSNGHAKE